MERGSWKFLQSLISVLLLMVTFQGWAQTPVYNKDQLKIAINNGESVLLKNNIDIDFELTISKSLTLDLGGYTLKREQNAGDIICVKCIAGKIRIINGNIITKQNKKALGGYGTGLDVSGAEVTIVNCNVSGYTKSWSVEDATGIQFYSGSLNIISGTFVGEENGSGKSYAIWSKNSTINNFLKGSYLKKGDNIVSNVNTKTIEGSVTAHPVTYTLDYQLKGGKYESSSYVKTYKALDIFNQTIDNLPEVSYRGYRFNYWSYENENILNAMELPYPYVTSDNHTIKLTANWSIKEYTISYDLNKGINNSSNPIGKYTINTNGGNDIQLQDPERKGYKFSAWRDSKGTVTSINYDRVERNAFSNSGVLEYKLTASWQPITYNITFDKPVNNGKTQIEYTVEISDISLPEPDNIPMGKSFAGWYISGTDTQVKEIPVSNPDNLSLEVRWKDKTYYAFFYDGEVEINKKPFTVTSGLASFEDPKPKEGYIFDYWMDAPTNGKKITSISTNNIGDKKIYASWAPIKYTLTYDLNGGSYTGNRTITYTYNERAILLTSEQVSYSGHKFLGWKLDGKSITEAPVSGGIESDGGRKMSFTLSADWELINYDIVFNENGGTAVDDRQYNVKEGISAENMPKTERIGYTFAGWYNDQDRKVPSIPPGSKKLILTARWELIVYKITYNLFGGTNPNNAHSTYTYEDMIDLPSPTREHYDFGGWFTEKELVNAVSVIERTSTGDKVFYAKWSPKTYKLTFNPTGGRISQTEQNYIYGEVTEFARKPYKDHYKFDGWYYDEACTKAYGSKIAADNSGDHTLYAKWKLEDYKIVLDSYNGEFPSGANVPTTYTYESTIEKLPEPIRQGFTFAGWYADDLLTKPVSSPVIKKGESGDKKFYATWDRGYQVIFTQPAYGKITVSWNGSAVSPGTMIGKGESLAVTAEATNVNYELKQILINGKPFTSSPQLVTMPKEDLKITAEFTEASTPAASAPELIITPSGVDKFPKGEDVKVQLKKTDESTTLYYNLAGVEKKYEKEFVVASAQDTVLLKAIARKQGLRDGVISRYIIFDNGKITLTFNLPLGVKAVNPSGGEVVTATTTGGSFEFELKVDREYYTNLDSMVVSANDSVIKAGSAGLYTLTNCTSDVTITVAGLKAKLCSVTLQQTDNGTISFTEGAEETTMEVEYGTSVSVTAKADEDFKFLQWSTGSQSNPLKLTVDKDTTISARFINDYKAYAITLPQLEGVTVRPFTGYSTEVKKDGTFKFYLKLADGYREENPVVRANGEVLAKNKGGYAIYKVNKNISISVEGIVRESVTMKVPGNVNAKVVETMSNASKQEVYEETMILLHAEAPAGKIFDKWTDGKTDNPRMVPAVDAEQLHPLFTNKGDAAYAKVILNQSPGAGITAVNANIDGVKTGETVQLNVVLLPAYSQSEVTLTVDDEVLKPSVSLRAASETKTYMYSLPVKKDEITVKVSGMKLNTYNVSLAQTDGGVVYSNPAGTATHGDKIQLKAQPEPGMLFVKWWDGNTLNPYPYTVTADTEVKASFLGAESTVDNESIRKDDPIEITTDGNRLSIKVDKEYQVYIYNFGGGLYQKRKIPAGGYSMYLPSGEYLIKVGDDIVRKVIIL